jgi:thiamine biosynthesis lipoprotein
MPVKRIASGLQLALLGMSLSACQKAPELSDINESILAFGTFVEVQVLDVPAANKQEILQVIEKDLAYMHYAYHPWRSGPTGRTNQLLETAGEFTANPSMVKIIERSKELSVKSNHLFNPAIGHLMKLWGYHDEFPPEGPPPESEDIKALLTKNPTMDSISIRGIRISNTNPAVKLDLGGIAKGYALDEISEQLRMLGVRHAIINTGGDLKVIGQHRDRPWHIGIRHPRKEGVIAGIDAYDGEAVITSGDYERYYEFEGKRYHHIIDPSTGYPADGVQSVTVIHMDATLADAAATALFIAGPDKWVDTAQAMGIDTAMLIDSNGKIHLTQKMQQRISFEQPVQDINIVTLK